MSINEIGVECIWIRVSRSLNSIAIQKIRRIRLAYSSGTMRRRPSDRRKFRKTIRGSRDIIPLAHEIKEFKLYVCDFFVTDLLVFRVIFNTRTINSKVFYKTKRVGRAVFYSFITIFYIHTINSKNLLAAFQYTIMNNKGI